MDQGLRKNENQEYIPMITVSWKPNIGASSNTASQRYYPGQVIQADQAEYCFLGGLEKGWNNVTGIP
jgi:hypothetical protein